MPKEVAIYGPFVSIESVTFRQRFWKWIFHRTGPKAGERWYKKRVWRTVTRRKEVRGKGRFELHGSGRDLLRAIIDIKKTARVPKGYVRVSAEEFLRNPKKFSREGDWLDIGIES